MKCSRVTGTTPKHPRTGGTHIGPQSLLIWRGNIANQWRNWWAFTPLFEWVANLPPTMGMFNFSSSLSTRKNNLVGTWTYPQKDPGSSWNHSFGFWSGPSVGFWGCILTYYKHIYICIYTYIYAYIQLYTYVYIEYVCILTCVAYVSICIFFVLRIIFMSQHLVRHWLVWQLWALPLQLSSWVLLLWHQWWHGRSEIWTTCTVRI